MESLQEVCSGSRVLHKYSVRRLTGEMHADKIASGSSSGLGSPVTDGNDHADENPALGL